jgi:hypothetical protein
MAKNNPVAAYSQPVETIQGMFQLKYVAPALTQFLKSRPQQVSRMRGQVAQKSCDLW